MKKFIRIILCAIIIGSAQQPSAKEPVVAQQIHSVSDLASRLEALEKYNSSARFTVSMPQMADDVIYDIQLTQQASDSDRLDTDSYLIDWTLTNYENNTHGFSAYYNGNHFRFSGDRLQEYHLDWDSIPFRPALIGLRSEGVHRATQFFNILPQGIAAELRRIETDSTWRVVLRADTMIGGRRAVAINSVRRINGVVATEGEYIFDPATALPRRITFENNPGSISEQSVYIEFTDCQPNSSDSESLSSPINEKWLADRYPEEFGRFRESNFSIENLPGQRLPGFALATSTGERYARRAGEPFRAPTIIALLDGEGGFTASVIADVRSAVDRMPINADVIWAFTDNVVDRVEPIVGDLRPGEHLLMKARSLVRDCGAASLPTLILADREGNVGNVIIGYNKELASDVIQKMTLMR